MSGSSKLTAVDVAAVAAQLGIDFKNEAFSLDKLRIGLDAELAKLPEDADVAETAKAVAGRLREAPDFYTPVIKKGAKAAAAAAPAAAAAAEPARSLWDRIKAWLGMS